MRTESWHLRIGVTLSQRLVYWATTVRQTLSRTRVARRKQQSPAVLSLPLLSFLKSTHVLVSYQCFTSALLHSHGLKRDFHSPF